MIVIPGGKAPFSRSTRLRECTNVLPKGNRGSKNKGVCAFVVLCSDATMLPRASLLAPDCVGLANCEKNAELQIHKGLPRACINNVERDDVGRGRGERYRAKFDR